VGVLTKNILNRPTPHRFRPRHALARGTRLIPSELAMTQTPPGLNLERVVLTQTLQFVRKRFKIRAPLFVIPPDFLCGP
jgi:hypothetical protein